jgi:hypothetical protein
MFKKFSQVKIKKMQKKNSKGRNAKKPPEQKNKIY